MAELAYTARVNKALLSSHIGMNVRLVGKVTLVDSQRGTAQLEASDKGTVFVKVNPDSLSIYTSGPIVELVGTVNPDLSISELAGSVVQFGERFNMDIYNQTIETMQQYRYLWGPS
eukprot:TRINITY_DN31780_c0_g1_i1.p1 TRINITY_DN31780_c0_g1~~TRINITY_DN31780_c0_g1_i1.p1  ORF type:complete len:116 (+),score=10.77 TRINITY_DN31780_c0_g1_i1:104-451(+)